MSPYRDQVQRIAELVYDNKCIFFIGAGVSAIGSIYPSMPELNRRVISCLVGKYLAFARKEQELLPYIDRYFPELVDRVMMIAAEARLEAAEVDRCIRDEMFTAFDPAKGLVNDAHRLIAAAGVSLVATTNYDHALEMAYRHFFGEPRVVSAARKTTDIPDGRPTVIKLYGSVGEPEAIISDEAFKRVLMSLQTANKDTAEAQALSLLFDVCADKHIVFLGYSLRDPAFNAVLELRRKRSPKDWRDYAVSGSIQPTHGVEHVRMDIMEFLIALRLELVTLFLERMEEEFKERIKRETMSIENIAAHYRSLTEDRRRSFHGTDLAPIFSLAQQYTQAAAERDGHDLPRYDFQFHRRINELGGNEDRFTAMYLRKLSFVSNTHSQEVAKQHDAIANGLHACDFDRARVAMERHLECVQEESRFWGEYFRRIYLLVGKYRLDDRVDLRQHDGTVLTEKELDGLAPTTLLLGNSGMGKSTLLVALMMRYTLMGRIPLFLDLRIPVFQDLLLQPTIAVNMDRFFMQYCKALSVATGQTGEGSAAFHDNARRYLIPKMRMGAVHLLADSLDSIAQDHGAKGMRTAVSRLNIHLQQTHPDRPNVPVIPHATISCRYEEYNNCGAELRPTEEGTCCIVLAPLNQDQVESFKRMRNITGGRAAAIDLFQRYYPDRVTFVLLELVVRYPADTVVPPTITDIYRHYSADIGLLLGDAKKTLQEYKKEAQGIIHELTLDLTRAHEGPDRRVLDHPSFEEFIVALALNLTGDPDFIMERVMEMVDKPEWWPVLFFLAGNMTSRKLKESVLVEVHKRIDAQPRAGYEYMLLRFLNNLGHASGVEPTEEDILNAFMCVVKGLDIDGQIPTPEVAAEFKHIGERAVPVLLKLLAPGYRANAPFNSNTRLAAFVATKSEGGKNTVRPEGMLRRLAIDCLAQFTYRPDVQDALIAAYATYHALRASGLDEWEHNMWHLAIAFNTRHHDVHFSERIRDLHERYDAMGPEFDTVSRAELLFHMWASASGNTNLRTALEERLGDIIEKDLVKCIALGVEPFLWRRAHASGVVERLCSVRDERIQILLRDRILDKVIQLAGRPEQKVMVRYYASITLGRFAERSSVDQLVTNLDRAMLAEDFRSQGEETIQSTGWILFAALHAIDHLLDSVEVLRKLDSAGWRSVADRVALVLSDYRSGAKPKVDDLAVGKAIIVLGKVGRHGDVAAYKAVIESFREKHLLEGSSLLAAGHLKDLVSTALSRLSEKDKKDG
jgi:DNA-binding FadR family transcriptional regulator